MKGGIVGLQTELGGAFVNESVIRRLRRADAWRHQLDRMHVAVGRPRIPGLSGGLRLGGEIAMDLVESLRMRRLVPYPGQPHLAALDARVRLPQDPRYRSYWYDPSTHSMVGMHLGIDLIRHGVITSSRVISTPP